MARPPPLPTSAAVSVADVLRLNPNPFSPPQPPPPFRRLSIYHPSLRLLPSLRSLPALLQAHAQLVASGLLRHPLGAGLLLRASAAAAPLPHTLLLFRHLPAPDPFCANTVIRALSLSPEPLLALQFFFANLRTGFAPNSFSFPPLLAACGRATSLHASEKCHAQALKRGVDAVLHVRNSLIHVYSVCGLLEYARVLFDEMPHRDVISWNSMVDGYAEAGDLDAARELFDMMPERNVVSWNVMISGYLKGKSPECGLEIFREMGETGLRGNVNTMVSVVTSCGRLGLLKEGRSVHGYYIRNFAEENLIFGTALVDMYCKCWRVEIARRVFDRMSMRNLVCWNAMVTGHSIFGNPEDGLALFQKMVGRGEGSEDGGTNDGLENEPTRILPDEITFAGVLCACARAGLLAEGKKYFNEMTSLYKIMPNFAHYWCMANLYGSLGLVQEAVEVLRSTPEETGSRVLGGLLGLCRFHGGLELGESMVERLIELEPSNVSHYALLCNIYVAAGKWGDVHKMKQTFKERGVRLIPGHRLVDLNEIVCNFKVEERSQPKMEEIYMLINDLASRLRLTSGTVDSIESGQK
ncbi:pentatricopeptide repeat-containing protein At3g51320-like [Phoenix dactylifera]|uniref:Pentatricopeptide repeat-containing protein At3g51320-like n=1 Tax=Phoenix dactylifera TaxID=42345 RepID=A0A8B7C1V2_PHODC|nr:pentatricopeptide repeat-containing protein At3g51320-like [Phoenix dactylifera]